MFSAIRKLTFLAIPALVVALTGWYHRWECRAKQARNDQQVSFGANAELGPQTSPDGTQLAFEYFHPERPNVPQIWVMNLTLGFASARPLVENGNYNAEFSWSANGEWICYISHPMEGAVLTGQVYKVRVRDGTIEQLTHLPEGTALGDSTSWSNDDRIAFEMNDVIYAVDAHGGLVSKLLDAKNREPKIAPAEIRWSPDGMRLAFTGNESDSRHSNVWIADLKKKTISPVTNSRWDGTPSWYDNDHLLFSRGISGKQTKTCMLCLETNDVKCLTKESIDFSPWRNAQTKEIFVARGAKSDGNQMTSAFFAGFHIWKLRLTN